MIKQILYIDMDNVLVDFQTGIDACDDQIKEEYNGRLDEIPHIFSKMQPMADAIESFDLLSKYYDVFILSTSPWNNPSAWQDKVKWVQKYLGNNAYKRLILTHHKNLNKGDYLIDDRTKNGADKFEGELILFGNEQYPNWAAILRKLIP